MLGSHFNSFPIPAILEDATKNDWALAVSKAGQGGVGAPHPPSCFSSCDNSIALIQYFQPELLMKVFIECLSPEPEPELCGPSTPPLLLGRICRYWRTVALATPYLWSHIHVSLNFHNIMAQTSWVDSWLERSKKSPLSVSLMYYSPADSHPVFDSVLQHTHRW